jgi:uncharacterized OsmC-like protein
MLVRKEHAMANAEQIKTAFERNVKAVTLRPSVGQGTAVTKARIRDGLTCEIEDGRWKLTGDEDKSWAGNAEGPDPGVFGRAALASCLAIGYAMWAAKLGVPIAKLEVEVQTDYDARGLLGIDPSLPPGWTAVRYVVAVESDAPEADVMRVLDEGDRYSSILDCFRRPLPVEREVHITAPAT